MNTTKKINNKFKKKMKHYVEKNISWYDSEYLIKLIIFFLNCSSKFYEKFGHHKYVKEDVAQMRKAARMLQYSLDYEDLNVHREIFQSNEKNPYDFFKKSESHKGYSELNKDWTDWERNFGNTLRDCIERKDIFRPGGVKDFDKSCHAQIMKIRRHAFDYIARHMGRWWD